MKFKKTLQNARKKWHQTHKQHERMLLYIKILIILGLTVMAGMYRYTDFINQHGDLFASEIATYVVCTVVAYVFLRFMRNQPLFEIWSFFTWVVATIFIACMAELSGMNTKFVQDESHYHTTGSNEYRKKALDFKEKLWGRMILSVNATFLIGLCLYHLKENDRPSYIILVLGVIIAVISIWIPQVKEIHKKLAKDHWIDEDEDVSDSQIGVFIVGVAVVSVLLFMIIFLSFFRYDSFKIYSYFVDNPNMCGMKRSLATIIVFLSEAFVVGMLFAAPILYVSNNRNKPELGHQYKFLKDKEAFLDFGLLTFKIFVFLVALQATGMFDGYNENFCRTSDGCNKRITKATKTHNANCHYHKNNK